MRFRIANIQKRKSFSSFCLIVYCLLLHEPYPLPPWPAVVSAYLLASCLIYAWPLPSHHPAYRNKHFTADDNEMGSDQSAVRSSFGCVLLLNQIYLTMPLWFIWSICYGN